MRADLKATPTERDGTDRATCERVFVLVRVRSPCILWPLLPDCQWGWLTNRWCKTEGCVRVLLVCTLAIEAGVAVPMAMLMLSQYRMNRVAQPVSERKTHQHHQHHDHHHHPFRDRVVRRTSTGGGGENKTKFIGPTKSRFFRSHGKTAVLFGWSRI